jgi:hypothetical protein
LKALVRIFNSTAFSIFTHRVGAYLLLISNLILPLGLHRPWMGVSGWWLFPSSYCLAGIGALRYVNTHDSIWSVLVWPYALLFAFDAWLLAIAPAPFETAPKKDSDTTS